MIHDSFPFGPASLVVLSDASDHPHLGSLMARMPLLEDEDPPPDPPDEAFVVVAAGGAADVLVLEGERSRRERCDSEAERGRENEMESRWQRKDVSVLRCLGVCGVRRSRRSGSRASLPL